MEMGDWLVCDLCGGPRSSSSANSGPESQLSLQSSTLSFTQTADMLAIQRRLVPRSFVRSYKVLSIETSCDDACVALLDRFDSQQPPTVLANLKRTLDSKQAGGVVPTDAHVHIQQSLTPLIAQVCAEHGLSRSSPPELVCVTHGPGMAGSLSAGIDVAKGLALAWGSRFIGVNHLLAHLLTPRISTNGEHPDFPFLTLLASGGHTMLVLSSGLLEHEILLNTRDISAGDALDKCARHIGVRGNMIGKALEEMLTQHPEDANVPVELDIKLPLLNKPGRANVTAFSFSAFITQVSDQLAKSYPAGIPSESVRRALGFKIQNAIFEHIIDKVNLCLSMEKYRLRKVKSLVVSGGVASNMTLRSMLETRLIKQFEVCAPPPALCTDNALMIGWTGIELYEKYSAQTDFSIRPIRKWNVDELKPEHFQP